MPLADYPLSSHLLIQAEQVCATITKTPAYLVAAVFDLENRAFNLDGFSSALEQVLPKDTPFFRRDIGWSILTQSEFARYALDRLKSVRSFDDETPLDWYILPTRSAVGTQPRPQIRQLEVSFKRNALGSIATDLEVKPALELAITPALEKFLVSICQQLPEDIDTFCLVYEIHRLGPLLTAGVLNPRASERFKLVSQRFPLAFALLCRATDASQLIASLSPFISFTLTPLLCQAAALADARATDAVVKTEERTAAIISHNLEDVVAKSAGVLHDIDGQFNGHSEYTPVLRTRTRRAEFSLQAELAFYHHAKQFSSRNWSPSQVIETSRFKPAEDLPRFGEWLRELSNIKEPFTLKDPSCDPPDYSQPVSIDKWSVWHILRILVDNSHKIFVERADTLAAPWVSCQLSILETSSKKHLKIEVTDTCGGFKDDDVRHLLVGPLTWERVEDFWEQNRKLVPNTRKGLGFLIIAGYAKWYNGKFALTDYVDRTTGVRGLKATVHLQCG